ncbi:MAG: nitrilase-related carbon-nitrogen hydrolase, partial [Rouxiella aceris]|uniref:nitrilase-related carbon-nitrogen hydrolase n=1 Tax=Rouxiella aceris TaxID=2703884 RepID=UPI002847BD1A
NQCYVAYANYSGYEDAIHYCGLSSIVGPQGLILNQTGQQEGLVGAKLDRNALNASRNATPYLLDRRPELYRQLANQ